MPRNQFPRHPPFSVASSFHGNPRRCAARPRAATSRISSPGPRMRLLDELASDVRHGMRALRREPAVVAGVLFSFALALGANAALLGLVRRLLVAPPPGVADAARLQRVTLAITGDDGERYTVGTTSYPAYRALAASPAFASVAAARPDTLTLGTGAAT